MVLITGLWAGGANANITSHYGVWTANNSLSVAYCPAGTQLINCYIQVNSGSHGLKPISVNADFNVCSGAEQDYWYRTVARCAKVCN